MPSVFMLSVVMLSVIMLSVVMLSVVILSVVMLSVIILSVIILSPIIINVIRQIVVAPFKIPHLSRRLDSFKERQVETAVDDENAEGQTQDRGSDVTDAVTLLDLENGEAGKWKRKDYF